MRRESTSSDTASTASLATTCSLIKEDAAVAVEEVAVPESKHRRIRQKARRVLADLGAPPTARQDAKDGKRTLNFADPGGLVGESVLKAGRI